MYGPNYPVGTTYVPRGKHRPVCTVIDVLRTYNSAGELTQIRYVAEHELAGCKVIDRDVLETTIRMGSPIVPNAPVASQEPQDSPIVARVDELLGETETDTADGFQALYEYGNGAQRG